MSDSQRSSHNSSITIVVILAGLACGGVLTWWLTGAGRPAPEPDPPVLESQRLPWDELHPAVDDPDSGNVADFTPSSDAPATDEADDYDAAADRVVVQANRLGDDAGVTEFVKLDDERFIHVSVKLVLMASALAGQPDGRDMLVDYEARLLTEEKINPDDWYTYTKEIARDPERTAQMSEAILREAERRTDLKINVRGVSDLAPAQVADPNSQ